MTFKQLFGYFLLFSFLGFLGYKFFLSFGEREFGPLITFIAVIFLLLILFGIRKILREG